MAKETTRKVEDIAEAVQELSAISVISRSKATVLKLEAKALRAAMEKKGRESAEDLHRAQKLLRDVIILQDAARTKKAVKLQATNVPNVTAKKTVRLVESPKPEKQLPRGPDKGTEDDIIVDEFLKDEESRALLRRASTFQPITAPAVCNPDDDIVAMVAKMVEDKTGSATASVTPVLE
ncbi:hypothetical protein HPB49_002440 [Dermacentor silvarum]|uniref:Uncharacterized protein n=1 Tax=Dermacentor silvarum TaxID=543639 RepID=A0ACB8C0P8_DERSI|nr:hypothetical protein HPB49_002440 [Dermacentor silvarum]